MIEKRGRQLTPGERVRVWIDNLIKVWPILIPLLGASAYNSETVRKAIHGPLPPVEDVTKITSEINPEVRQAIEDLTAQGKRFKQQLRSLEQRDSTDQSKVLKEIQIINQEIEKWHGD